MIVHDDQRAVDAVMQSSIVRSASSLRDHVVNGWQTSALNRGLHVVAARRGETSADRLRFYALILATAAIAYSAIRAVVPAYAAPGTPWWWNGAIATGALLIANYAGAIAAGWRESTAGRFARYFSSWIR